MRNSHTVKIKIQKMEKSQLRILILTHTDFLVFTGFEQLKSKSNKTNNNNTNFNNIYLILSEVRKHHYGLDTMDFNDNVRKDFNYG